MAGRVRFVGDATARIREDYLRILRLFRFHAWYGKGEIDAAGLRAAAQEKSGIAKLSGERIAKEMLRLLEAENPAPVLRAMAASGILAEVLPCEANIARLDALAKIDAANFFSARCCAASCGAACRVTKRSRTDSPIIGRFRTRCARVSMILPAPAEKIVSYLSIREVRKLLYRLGVRAFKDRVLLKWAEDTKPSNGVAWRALLAKSAESYVAAAFSADRARCDAGGRSAKARWSGRFWPKSKNGGSTAISPMMNSRWRERLKAVVQAVGR